MSVAKFATHILVEYSGCAGDVLDDPQAIERALRAAADAANTTILACLMHQFEPQGVTGILALAGSHISIHTWPELGYAALDIYSCGERAEPARVIELMGDALDATSAEVMEIDRGRDAGQGGLQTAIGLRGHSARTRTEHGWVQTPVTPAQTGGRVPGDALEHARATAVNEDR